ncbi:uncharacterized protein si:ch211-136m16.8 [Myxocyprinus asiaticus]|uniref:uncharacterized protein si:ch211-136m16.8 n=1 Tax=Myxocyprinus asiaticus TaxID=70543 RepID=UPI002222D93B|nr:uncharacterized protein si:ch211-136m16.8 [Myxocyprinus asiaticus]XP_051530926.1 uncharacterized protein si:ch211-136m16.8 [Myxocyprinus asiaticus]
MDASENSGSRFGRSIWTVWGYLTGAVARYLRPEVTDEGNQNNVVSKNTANEINREEKENEAEKKVEGKKCNENENNTEVKCVLPEARMQGALAQWENTNVVTDDHIELHVNTTKKQTYHCAVWSIGTNHGESVSGDDVDSDGHKQKSGTRTLDVQIDDKNEERQKSEARVEKEPVSSDASCEERKVSETEEEPVEIVDSKQKDGSSKDKKEEECDHEDDSFQVCDFMREDQNNAEVTIKSELYGQDVEQEKLINKVDYRETADIRGTEYTTDFPKEKGVECVIDEKEQQTVVQNQQLEKVEDFEDEGTESQVKDGDSKEDSAFSNPLEIERLEVIKKHSEEMIENEHISKNELGSMDTTEQDKDIQESEQLDWLDTCELAGTGICNIEESYDGRLGETQTAQTKNVDETKSELLKLEVTLPRASEEIFEEIVRSNEPGRNIATVVDSFFETVATSKDTLQSDLSKQDTLQTGTGPPVVAIKTEAVFSDLIVSELFGELRKGPEVGSVKTGAVDQVKTVETALGCIEEIKTNLDQPNTLTEEHSQRDSVVPHSVELELKDSKEAIEIEQDIETPIDYLNATLQEMDKTKFSLKKHALTFETVEAKISSRKANMKTYETNSQADSELLELTTVRECKLSQATMDTVSESPAEGERKSVVVCAIAGTEPYPVDMKLDAEDAPDVVEVKIGPVGSQTGLTRPLSPAEFLVETLDLKKDSDIYSEGQENIEIRLLDETDALKTTLEYVDEIINQVLKEMIEMENNVGQEVEPLVGLSTEKLGDAEFQELPTGTLVLEQENMEASEFLAGTEESIVEMETSICEVVKKQNDDRILSPVSETTDAVEHIEEKGTAGEAVLCCHEDIMEISKSRIKRRFENVSKDVPEVKIGEEKAPTTDWPTTVNLDLQAFKDSYLDFSVQKSRIAVKNPLVRPPKDPRKLIFKASVEPFLPKPPACGLLKGGQGIAVSVPSKGVIGFKLPGMMPALKKTEFGKKAREYGEAESRLQVQEQQKSVAITEDSVKQEPVSLKPKWTPPRHPGMGSPLMMAELKGKLKKPLKE